MKTTLICAIRASCESLRTTDSFRQECAVTAGYVAAGARGVADPLAGSSSQSLVRDGFGCAGFLQNRFSQFPIASDLAVEKA